MWGRRVPFDCDAIHASIKDYYMANLKISVPFAIHVAKGNYDYNHIIADIFKVEKTYELGRDGQPIHFKRPNLTTQAQIKMTFILHNIILCNHTLFATLQTAQLIWYILKGK